MPKTKTKSAACARVCQPLAHGRMGVQSRIRRFFSSSHYAQTAPAEPEPLPEESQKTPLTYLADFGLDKPPHRAYEYQSRSLKLRVAYDYEAMSKRQRDSGTRDKIPLRRKSRRYSNAHESGVVDYTLNGSIIRERRIKPDPPRHMKSWLCAGILIVVTEPNGHMKIAQCDGERSRLFPDPVLLHEIVDP